MYERILVPTDGSRAAERASHFGFALAEAYNTTVHALHVIDTGEKGWDEAPTDFKDARRQEGKDLTNQVADGARARGLTVKTNVQPGVPAEVIQEYTAANDVDLITMGTHGRTGLAKYLLGSTAATIVRTAPIPILTVREHDGTDADSDVDFTNVLVATDGSKSATTASEHGIDVAQRTSATVHGLFVIDKRAYTSRPGYTWDDAIRAWEHRGERVVGDFEEMAASNTDVQTTIRRGVPHQEILSYTTENDVDLVVMGTHGRSGWDRFVLGSVAERVVRSSDVPVLTVRTS